MRDERERVCVRERERGERERGSCFTINVLLQVGWYS